MGALWAPLIAPWAPLWGPRAPSGLFGRRFGSFWGHSWALWRALGVPDGSLGAPRTVLRSIWDRFLGVFGSILGAFSLRFARDCPQLVLRFFVRWLAPEHVWLRQAGAPSHMCAARVPSTDWIQTALGHEHNSFDSPGFSDSGPAHMCAARGASTGWTSAALGNPTCRRLSSLGALGLCAA